MWSSKYANAQALKKIEEAPTRIGLITDKKKEAQSMYDSIK